MREVKTKVYTYNELSDDSRKKVWTYLCSSDFHNDIRCRTVKRRLSLTFPNSDVYLIYHRLCSVQKDTTPDSVDLMGRFTLHNIIEFCTDVICVRDYRKLIDFPNVNILFDVDCTSTYEISAVLASHIHSDEDEKLVKTLENCFRDKILSLQKEIVDYWDSIPSFNDSLISDLCTENKLEFYSDGRIYLD